MVLGHLWLVSVFKVQDVKIVEINYLQRHISLWSKAGSIILNLKLVKYLDEYIQAWI